MPVPGARGLVSRSLLRDDAYRAIRDAIVDGTLAPGERLNDGDLTEWLGVSRTPVREALARLERAGLVQTKPGRHTIVSPVDVRAARNALSVTGAMFELAVREAIPHLSTADFDAMREANARFAEALRRGDVVTYIPPVTKEPVTHRIISIERGPHGERVYRTKGDNNDVADLRPFTLDEPHQARVAFAIPYLGWLFILLAMQEARILLIALPGVLLALWALYGAWRQGGELLAERETA